MKPRYRPGKPATKGQTQRQVISDANSLSSNQMEHLKQEKTNPQAPKAGRGGHRADWNIDYEEGVRYDKKTMPNRENESMSKDGVRRFPKKGH